MTAGNRTIRARCAPDLDGDGHDNLLVEVAKCLGRVEGFRTIPCSAGGMMWRMGVLAAVSPLIKAGGQGHLIRELGYTEYYTDMGEGWTIRFERFVHLPDGSIGVQVHSHIPVGGDCGYETEEERIVTASRGRQPIAPSHPANCRPTIEPGKHTVW